MLFYGVGAVALIVMSVFSFLKVDMGVEGEVGGWVCAMLAAGAFLFFCQKTREFVSGENVLGWLI